VPIPSKQETSARPEMMRASRSTACRRCRRQAVGAPFLDSPLSLAGRTSGCSGSCILGFRIMCVSPPKAGSTFEALKVRPGVSAQPLGTARSQRRSGGMQTLHMP
jgi:hypothetical protein